MKAIGGYPELELRKGEHYHKEAIRLNTARNCLEYILLARQYKKVYVPYYTCDAILEPFHKSPVFKPEIQFYRIDRNFDPIEIPNLSSGEAFLYTNYFGLKQETIGKLVKSYGNRLIVDNSQAFFDLPQPGIDTFYSARKFFGVSDGAYLYTDHRLLDYYGLRIDRDCSFARMNALIKRIDLGAEAGYEDFQKIEESLRYEPIKLMSRLTESILESIDYEAVRNKRRRNIEILYDKLFQLQRLEFEYRNYAVPMCYPFLAKESTVRSKLIANKVYVPMYWPNVLNNCGDASIEYLYASRLLPLPIDQRYDEEDMSRIASLIIKYN